jgi:hypothetical protein
VATIASAATVGSRGHPDAPRVAANSRSFRIESGTLTPRCCAPTLALANTRREESGHAHRRRPSCGGDVNDPQGRGRLLVTPPRQLGLKPMWAPVDSGDEVLIAFEDGDSSKPVVLGSLWTESATGVTIEAQGSRIRIDASGIKIESAAKVEVAASAMEVSAGTLTVNAGMSKFSGVVQCDTLIANSVVASSYTPGAGNVM